MDGQLQPRIVNPLEALFVASLALTGPHSDADEEWRLLRERWRDKLLRYLQCWYAGGMKGQRRKGPPRLR